MKKSSYMEELDLGGHGHVGAKPKKKSIVETLSFTAEERVSRRHSSAQAGRESRSIFDAVGDEGGLEGLLFTPNTGGLSRDMSMSPFSRIRTDLENFVEEGDRDLEAKFLGQKSPGLRQVPSFHSIPNSPLIDPPIHIDPAECKTVWIGNVDRETGEAELRRAFDAFGAVQSVKLLDGFAFVRYESAEETNLAIDRMNGQVLGRTVIKTGPGRDEFAPPRASSPSLMNGVGGGGGKSVWVGNLPVDIEERLLQRIFSQYGGIESIRLVPGKRCAFVNYCRAEQAAAALLDLEGRLKFGEEPVKLGYAKHTAQSVNGGSGSSTTTGGLLGVPGASLAASRRRQSTGSMGMNQASLEAMDFGDSTSIESLKNIFGALDIREETNGFQSAILTPVPKPPVIVTTPSSSSTGRVVDSDDSAFNWEIPELPQPYFGPDLTPGRIRDYRRHVESMSCKPSEFDLIAMEVLPVSVAASTDPVGNVLVQKLIERGSDDLKSMIIAELEPFMAAIGVHKNGTWVVQKLINWCTLPEQQMQVANALRPYVVPLLQDQYGNYVVQCCLQFDQGRNQFIMDGMAKQCLRVATSRFGSRAMRSCLESPHTSAKQQKLVANAILEQAQRLLLDPNGVIVMQWLLDSEMPGKYRLLLPAVEGILPVLVGLRFASNLVSKLLTQTAEPEVRDRLLDLLIKDPTGSTSSLQAMLREPTCIQIISKILLTVSSSLQKMSFLDAVRSALTVLLQGGAASSHLHKLWTEVKDVHQTNVDLSHLVASQAAADAAPSDTTGTPSPAPVVMSSRLKSHQQDHHHHQDPTTPLLFGTHLALPKPAQPHRHGSRPQNQP